jgi:alpha-galactosidase/6-phospho-beta-glucosidase family protein
VAFDKQEVFLYTLKALSENAFTDRKLMSPRATISDVAKKAGVSISTFSWVLNGTEVLDAVTEGDRQKALQYLLLDPVVNDFEQARQILDDYLSTYKEYLPQFWK